MHLEPGFLPIKSKDSYILSGIVCDMEKVKILLSYYFDRKVKNLFFFNEKV